MVSLDGRPGAARTVESSVPLAEEILGAWRETVGPDFTGYHNHVCRVINYSLALRSCSDEEREKLVIAACFHDLGIWSANTSDYLRPSAGLAADYLRERGREDWVDEVRLMIATHHKLREFNDDSYGLVEVLRQADLIDVSLGVQKFGLPGPFVAEVKRAYPNAGFHWRLVKLFGEGLRQRPWNPLPIFKW